MQIIYNITLTLWVIVYALYIVDERFKRSRVFEELAGYIVTTAVLMSFASALAWIWS